MKRFLVFLLTFGCLIIPAQAVTRTAFSCEYVDVNNALNAVGTPTGGEDYTVPLGHGDTLILPAGTATWSTALVITKNIQLIGAGTNAATYAQFQLTKIIGGGLIDATFINDNNICRISGINFHSNGSGTLINPTVILGGKQTIKVVGGSYLGGVRIDHCLWTVDPISAAYDKRRYRTDGWLSGVMDHCILDDDLVNVNPAVNHGEVGSVNHLTSPDGTGDGAPGVGHSSWNHTYVWGGGPDANGQWDGWYTEDCIFHMHTGGEDADGGSRRVYRHNLTSGRYTGHGTESGSKSGPVATEIYNNKFYQHYGTGFPRSNRPIDYRSGGGVVFNNFAANYNNLFSTFAYRAHGAASIFSYGDGKNFWDENERNNPLTVNGSTINATSVPADTRLGAIYATGSNATIGTGDTITCLGLTRSGLTTWPANFWKGFIVERNDVARSAVNYLLIIGNAADSTTLDFLGVFNQTHASTVAGWTGANTWEVRRVRTYHEVPGSGRESELIVGGTSPSIASPLSSPAPYFINADTAGIWHWNNFINTTTTPTSTTPPGFWTAVLDSSDPDQDSGVIRGIHNATVRTGYPWNGSVTSDIPATRVGPDLEDTVGTITTNWSGGPLYVDGQGGYTYPHPLVAPATGKIIVVTGDLAFGNTIIGDPPPVRTINVANTGDATLTVSSVTGYTSVFTGSSDSFAVSPGTSFNVNVTFTPLAEVDYTATITFVSDATSGTNTIGATGHGVLGAETGTPERPYNVYLIIKRVLTKWIP